MTLSTVLVTTVLIVALGFVGTCALCMSRAHVRQTWVEAPAILREIAPYLAFAGAFLLVKNATSELSIRISYAIDWDITDEIYAIEGEFVALLQEVVPEVTTGLFSVFYMFGFPYLLVTAPVLYVTLPSPRRLKELLIAYLLNYAVGAIFYTLFIAYGPRNHLDSVGGLMYDFYPRTQELTAAISDNTNVFPSLHTSLAVVVLLFAWRTRREFPRWFGLATIVASAVVFSTMYLGIHWAIDVVAGIVLALWSVSAAESIVGRVEGDRRSSGRDPAVGSDADIGD